MAARALRVHPMTCGTLTIPASYLTPGAGAGDAPVRTSVGMFLIEHPSGRVLFDVGSAPETADGGAAAWWGEEVARAFPYEVARGEIIDRQLAARGLGCGDVGDVVLSHLHLDHAGALRLFPEARVHVHERELLDAAWPLAGFDVGCYHLPDLLPARTFDMRRVTGEVDLFGDGAVRLFETPGHTRGHLSMVVELERTGRVVLPGDACFCPESLRLSLPPGDPLPAPGLWRASLGRIRALVEQGATPLFSHLPVAALPSSPCGQATLA